MAREARKRGHALSDASATAYFAGRHGTPDDATIAAFSEVLRIPESEIRKAAGVTAVGEPWIPPQSSRYLRDDQRAALEQLISTMVEREEGGGAHDGAAAKTQAASAADPVIDPAVGTGGFTALIVKRYLKQAEGDAATAASLLAHDGAKGANTDPGTWNAALGELFEMIPPEKDLELPEDVAARRSKDFPPPMLDS